MKKVVRFFAIAALAFGMTNLVACGGDEEEGDGNGNNTQQEEQGEPVLLDENFNNGIPSTWTNIDADGDSYAWMRCSEVFSEGYGVDGSDCAASASFINGIGALSADNYLVTPTMHIPGAGGYKLTYYVGNFQAEYPDSYSVLVGTVENGVFVSKATLYSGESPVGLYDNNDPMEQKTFNLDEFKGQDIQIAFRHNCTDMYWLMIDNVKVSNE